jgi:hypothetical protein
LRRLTILVHALLAAAVAFGPFVPTGLASPVDQPRSGLGAAAAFLAPETSLYLAIDLDPSAEHSRVLDRLSSIYLDAPEGTAAVNDIGDRLGVDIDIQSTLAELRPILGGEAFLAVPDVMDLVRLAEGRGTRSEVERGERDVPNFVLGAELRDLAGLRQFLLKMRDKAQAAGARIDDESGDIIAIRGPRSDRAVYVTVRGRHVFVSTDREILVAIGGRGAVDSLASNPDFASALARTNTRGLGLLYSKVPKEALSYQAGALGQTVETRWIAASLQLSAQQVLVRVAASIDSHELSPGRRAALEQRPLVPRSAAASPSNATFYVASQNIKAQWEATSEALWPDPADRTRQVDRASRDLGVNIAEDVVGWMDGEFALFASFDSTGGTFRPESLKLGLLIEARDPAAVRPRLERVVAAIDRLAGAPGVHSKVAVSGVTVDRFRMGPGVSIELGMLDSWVVATLGDGTLENVVAALRGGPSLARNEEFRAVRAAIGDPMGFVAFLDVPEVVRITTSEASASRSGPGALADRNPARGAGLGVYSTPDQVDGAFVVRLVLPGDEERPIPPPGQAPAQAPAQVPRR